MLGLPEDDSPLALSSAQDTWSEALKGAEGTLRKLFISHTRVSVSGKPGIHIFVQAVARIRVEHARKVLMYLLESDEECSFGKDKTSVCESVAENCILAIYKDPESKDAGSKMLSGVGINSIALTSADLVYEGSYSYLRGVCDPSWFIISAGVCKYGILPAVPDLASALRVHTAEQTSQTASSGSAPSDDLCSETLATGLVMYYGLWDHTSGQGARVVPGVQEKPSRSSSCPALTSRTADEFKAECTVLHSLVSGFFTRHHFPACSLTWEEDERTLDKMAPAIAFANYYSGLEDAKRKASSGLDSVLGRGTSDSTSEPNAAHPADLALPLSQLMAKMYMNGPPANSAIQSLELLKYLRTRELAQAEMTSNGMANEHVLEVFENSRRSPWGNWSPKNLLPTERAELSVRDGSGKYRWENAATAVAPGVNPSRMRPSDVPAVTLPDFWQWAPHSEWACCQSSQTDAEAWEYAFVWGLAYSHASTVKTFVRRRLWTRTMVFTK